MFNGCGGSDTSGARELVLYSGRSESLVGPLLTRFREETGIDVHVKYGNSAQLALAIQEEGDRSPADLFWSQDAGALGVLSKSQLFSELPENLLERVPKNFYHAGREWVATSGRARVLAYSTDRVEEAELPASVFDLTDPRWKDRVGWAPLNASFQSFVTAMRKSVGEERTQEWLSAMKANNAKPYPKNTAIIEALASGDIDLGLPNHYYLLRFKNKDADYPVEQKFFAARDIGNLVNVAGVGILRTSSRSELASELVRFLLSEASQQFFVNEVFEYPVTNANVGIPSLVGLDDLIDVAPPVELNELEDLEGTLDLLRKAGLL
jgi:iron(III) transport system substrate-binding protein